MVTDRNDLEKILSLSEPEDLPPMNIMNITGIVSNYGSIGAIPWTPVNKLPSRPMQPPSSRPPLCDKSQLPLSQELVNSSQRTTPGNLLDHSIQTLASSTADLSVLTESNNEELIADNSAAVALQVEVDQLKEKVAALVFMNNRYHLAIPNCTFCASDDDAS